MARLSFALLALVTVCLGSTIIACSGATGSSPTPTGTSGTVGGSGTGNGGGGNNPSGTGGSGFVVSSGGSTSATACVGTSTVGCKAQFAEGCGDGINNQGGIEECDDGNSLPGDGCNGACKVERNWHCPKDITQGPCTRDVICGDGVIGAGEVCDDANTVDGDGCNSTCTFQDPAFQCVAGQACIRVSQCGNKRIESGEKCDDGNATSGDGCSSSCQLEDGWVCPKPGSPCKAAPRCGDGVVSAALGEVCDDGNTNDDDGCSGNCKVKGEGCVCTPGSLCKCPTVACGDGKIERDEACDDGNKVDGDGCSHDCKAIESGYTCPFQGAPCVPDCGDGIVKEPMEQCDPGVKATNMDKACTSTCKWASGWACGGTPVTCHQTVCGDGKTEGTEGCDDGNTKPGDGCSPTCRPEPSCSIATGKCDSKCGDGIVMPAQPDGPVMPGGACDDGNDRSGDGCSSDCKVEPGYQCEQPPQTAPTMTVPITARDFHSGGDFEPAAMGQNAAVTGLVKTDLDSEGKPQGTSKIASSSAGGYITSTTTFGQWYRDSSSVNYKLDTTLTLYDNGNGGYVNRYGANGEKWQILSGPTQHWCGTTAQPDHDAAGKAIPCTFCPYDANPATPQCDQNDGTQAPQATDCQTIPNMLRCETGTDGTYHGIWLESEFDGSPMFFPVDAAPNPDPYVAATIPPPYGNWEAAPDGKKHNFSFTTEIHYWFGYVSSKTYTLDFMGDDDVWVFINHKLAVDLGGIHTPVGGTLVLNGNNSNVTITQSNTCKINNGSVTCPPTSTAKISPTTDLGLKDGDVCEMAIFQAERQTTASTYKLTLSGFNDNPSECKAICGDGVVSPGEQCDNGTAKNLGGYNQCTDQCLLGPYCGDGVVQSDQEQCDDGVNSADYGATGGCGPGCVLPASCGDGVVQVSWGEECDDGANNLTTTDQTAAYGGLCMSNCQLGGYCGDGQLNGPETCDDGANDGTYGTCNPDCTPAPKCGDGTVQEEYGENCEPAVPGQDDAASDGCTKGCRWKGGCGDGTIEAPEECDDGALFNNGDYGGCAPGCIRAPFCGDGVKNGPEAQLDGNGNVVVPAAEDCDDGDPSNPDGGGGDGSYGGCTKQCRLGPHCGDGIVQADQGETCDHGDQNGKDQLCTSACKKIDYIPG